MGDPKREELKVAGQRAVLAAVINPDECIDCGVCEPECPEDAIKSDQDPEGEHWVEFNKTWSQKWEVIDVKKDPLPDFEKHSGEQDKLMLENLGSHIAYHY